MNKSKNKSHLRVVTDHPPPPAEDSLIGRRFYIYPKNGKPGRYARIVAETEDNVVFDFEAPLRLVGTDESV